MTEAISDEKGTQAEELHALATSFDRISVGFFRGDLSIEEIRAAISPLLEKLDDADSERGSAQEIDLQQKITALKASFKDEYSNLRDFIDAVQAFVQTQKLGIVPKPGECWDDIGPNDNNSCLVKLEYNGRE